MFIFWHNEITRNYFLSTTILSQRNQIITYNKWNNFMVNGKMSGQRRFKNWDDVQHFASNLKVIE